VFRSYAFRPERLSAWFAHFRLLHEETPGLTAAEDRWQGLGEFTKVLMPALRGGAKAWSWERNCYEVRWEKLADQVKAAMELAKIEARHGHDPPEGGWPIQVPQDTGVRGVKDRQRDALLTSIPRTGVDRLKLTIKLQPKPEAALVDISVLDAVAEPVASVVKATGDAHEFMLQPRTYAVVAESTDERYGRLKAPIDLYEGPIEETIDLEPNPPDVEAGEGRGTIVVPSRDPLTIVELRNRGRPSGFGTIVAPAMAGAMKRANRKDLARLKSILERERS
jgi:hypothetical protein